MQKLQFIFLSIFLAVGFETIYSQEIVLERTINWKNTENENFNIGIHDHKEFQIYRFFKFDEADYSQREDFLPIYYELIPVNSENYSVLLKDIQSVPLTDKEKNLIDENKIPFETDYEQKVLVKRKVSYLSLSVFPFRKNRQTGKIYKITGFKLVISPKKKNKTQSN